MPQVCSYRWVPIPWRVVRVRLFFFFLLSLPTRRYQGEFQLSGFGIYFFFRYLTRKCTYLDLPLWCTRQTDMILKWSRENAQGTNAMMVSFLVYLWIWRQNLFRSRTRYVIDIIDTEIRLALGGLDLTKIYLDQQQQPQGQCFEGTIN